MRASSSSFSQLIKGTVAVAVAIAMTAGAQPASAATQDMNAAPASASSASVSSPMLGPVAAASQGENAGEAQGESGSLLTQPTENPITFPGPAIGQPSAEIDGARATLSNNALALTLDATDGLAITKMVNKLTGADVPFSAQQLFAFKINGQTFDLTSFKAEGAAREVAVTAAAEAPDVSPIRTRASRSPSPSSRRMAPLIC